MENKDLPAQPADVRGDTGLVRTCGLTKREEMAKSIMAGLCAGNYFNASAPSTESIEAVAAVAARCADALLAALEA